MVAPASKEACTSLGLSEVWGPGDVHRLRSRLEIEPGGVECSGGDLPTLEGTIEFLGAAVKQQQQKKMSWRLPGEVLFGPGGVFLSPGEGLFTPVAVARPAHVAAAGEGVVVVVFFPDEEAVVGSFLSVMRPALGRGVGDIGGQEVARPSAADARVTYRNGCN